MSIAEVILEVDEQVLIDLALTGLQGVGTRASRGVERPGDVALKKLCQSLLDRLAAAVRDAA